jgi:hypothetical protein
MMALLLVILIPLAAVVVYAVVSDLRLLPPPGAPRSHDISSAARTARADADARGDISLGQLRDGGVRGGGIGSGL